jgi:hypothetical protein
MHRARSLRRAVVLEPQIEANRLKLAACLEGNLKA